MTGSELGSHLDDAALPLTLFVVFGIIFGIFAAVFPSEEDEAPKSEVYWMEQESAK